MKLTIALAYLFLGTGLFVHLFRKFLQRGIADTGAQKENPFVQNYRVNMKLLTDFSYLLRFVALMIGLFAFVATIAYIANEWRPFDSLFGGE